MQSNLKAPYCYFKSNVEQLIMKIKMVELITGPDLFFVVAYFLLSRLAT